MIKYFIPSDRRHISAEVQELFESVKKEKSSFSAFCYGLALNDDEYFVLEGQFACVKCSIEKGSPYAIIKKDVNKTGFFLGVQKFNLRIQFCTYQPNYESTYKSQRTKSAWN